jgi:hypothetical protein
VFYHSNLSSCGRRSKRAGYGRVRSRNIYFFATCSLHLRTENKSARSFYEIWPFGRLHTHDSAEI